LLDNLNDGNDANDPAPLAIKNAIDALNTATAALVERGDPTAINALATTIMGENKTTDTKYTAGSRTALANALTAAGSGNLDVSDLDTDDVTNLKDALDAANNGLVDLSGLTAKIAEAQVLTSNIYTTASWNAVAGALTAAQTTAANGSATEAEVTAATTALAAAIDNLIYKPVVNTFTVAALSNTAAGIKAATSSNFTLSLQKSENDQTITLTGAVAGQHLTDDPGLTTWSITTGTTTDAESWLQSTGNSETVNVIIPSDTIGTIVIKAAAKDASSQTLTVTVTAFEDWHFDANHDEANATIVDARDYRIPTSGSGDTADWIAIAKQTVSGQDYYLVVRTEVIGLTKFDADSPYSNNYNSTDCDLKTYIDDWYINDLASGSLKNKAVYNNALETLGENYIHGYNSQYLGFSSPAATGVFNGAFPLSTDEAAEYISRTWYDPDGNIKYNLVGGTSSGGTKLKAYTNWEALSDGSSYSSWTRSPYDGNLSLATALSNTGIIGYYNVANTSVYARPALWVSADIFD
jgi:hypothetical protein